MREGKGAEEARKHKKKEFSTKTQASRRKRKKQKSKKCVCLVFCALLEETNENNFCLYVSVSSPQFGTGSGGNFGTFVFCVFFVEYTLDCRDKYKYLKPLWAKWSRYYFTSLGGALTGGHR